MADHYLGNPKLKKANIQIDFSEEEIREITKCSKDVVYFCEKYIKIVNIDEGLIPYEPYNYQKEIMRNITLVEVYNQLSRFMLNNSTSKYN